MIRTVPVYRPVVPLRIYIGIDNGVSGSIGWVDSFGNSGFFLTPVMHGLDYQKEAQYTNRVNTPVLFQLLNGIIPQDGSAGTCIAVIERPMVNPQRFKASKSALRALEATLITLEDLDIPKQYVDSKEWQKIMLPKGIKGSTDLKKASLDIGRRLFPRFAQDFKEDADGLLMAEWAKRVNL